MSVCERWKNFGTCLLISSSGEFAAAAIVTNNEILVIEKVSKQ